MGAFEGCRYGVLDHLLVVDSLDGVSSWGHLGVGSLGGRVNWWPWFRCTGRRSRSWSRGRGNCTARSRGR